jgi:hypothetical protein
MWRAGRIVNGLPDPFAASLPCFRFPSVTLPLPHPPFASPSTGRTQTPKEAGMKTDYAIIHKNWNGIEIEIRWNADYVVFDDGESMAHLEVESVKPARAPLPITETGYRSHFIQSQQCRSHGRPRSLCRSMDRRGREYACMARNRCRIPPTRALLSAVAVIR